MAFTHTWYWQRAARVARVAKALAAPEVVAVAAGVALRVLKVVVQS